MKPPVASNGYKYQNDSSSLHYILLSNIFQNWYESGISIIGDEILSGMFDYFHTIYVKVLYFSSHKTIEDLFTKTSVNKCANFGGCLKRGLTL